MSVWNSAYEAVPTDSTYVADVDDVVRELKTNLSTRIGKEHGFNLTESSPQTGHGKHLRGTARAFVSDTDIADPTTVTADDADYATGRLQVKPSSGRLCYYSGSAWVDVGGNTAGQLSSGVATGTPPLVVASTTKVDNLNADLLDGYNVGNGSGQIPVSNGTVCTDLNASKVQGYSVGTGANTLPYNNSSGYTVLGTQVIPTFIHPTALSYPFNAHMPVIMYFSSSGSFDYGARTFHGIRVSSGGGVSRVDSRSSSANAGDIFIGTFT